MEIEIDNLDEDGLVECSELYVSTFKEAPWNEVWSTEDAFERLSDFLACPNTISLKATQNSQISGFLIGEIQKWNGAYFYFLKEICVRGHDQRKRVGSSLIENLTVILKNQDVSRIYLITQRNSIPSSFYASLGYSENSRVMIMGRSVE